MWKTQRLRRASAINEMILSSIKMHHRRQRVYFFILQNNSLPKHNRTQWRFVLSYDLIKGIIRFQFCPSPISNAIKCNNKWIFSVMIIGFIVISTYIWSNQQQPYALYEEFRHFLFMCNTKSRTQRFSVSKADWWSQKTCIPADVTVHRFTYTHRIANNWEKCRRNSESNAIPTESIQYTLTI